MIAKKTNKAYTIIINTKKKKRSYFLIDNISKKYNIIV